MHDVKAYSLDTRLLKVAVERAKKVATVVVAQMLHDIGICTLGRLITIMPDAILCDEICKEAEYNHDHSGSGTCHGAHVAERS